MLRSTSSLDFELLCFLGRHEVTMLAIFLSWYQGCRSTLLPIEIFAFHFDICHAISDLALADLPLGFLLTGSHG
jgi:hypothetical protein